MRMLFHRLWHDEEGVTSIEYALLLAALAVGTLGGVLGLVEKISGMREMALEPIAQATGDGHALGVVR